MTTVLFKNKDKELGFAESGKVGIFSKYGSFYGEIGEVTDIKDTITGEYLKVGDEVYFETKEMKISGLSIIVKTYGELKELQPKYFIMGVALNCVNQCERFNHIIKTPQDPYTVDYSKDCCLTLYREEI